MTNGGFNTQINFAALRIDDELVLDPFGLDTVSDTPMKNYAVFDDFATNGNLDKTASGSRAYSTIELSGKKYCEYTVTNTGSGTTLGVHSSTPGKSILIEPNGTAKIDGTPNSPDSAISYAAKDIMGLAFDVDTSTLTVYKNGVEAKTITGSSQSGWKFSATVGVSANFGQQFFAYAIPDGYEDLHQTWEQYARTALGYALDRIAKLEGDNAELRSRIEQALARISSIETNEVDDDAVDTVLLTTVADLIERVEALEGA